MIPAAPDAAEREARAGAREGTVPIHDAGAHVARELLEHGGVVTKDAGGQAVLRAIRLRDRRAQVRYADELQKGAEMFLVRTLRCGGDVDQSGRQERATVVERPHLDERASAA